METKRYNANSTLGRPMNGPQKMVNPGRKAPKSAPKKARGAKATGARRPRPRLDPLSCEFVPPFDDDISETDSYSTDPDSDPEVARILREMDDLEAAASADDVQLEATLKSKTTSVGVAPDSVRVEIKGREADPLALDLPRSFWSILVDAKLCVSETNSVVLYSPGISGGPGAFVAQDLAELNGNQIELTMYAGVDRRGFLYGFGPVKAVRVLGHYYDGVLGQVVMLPAQ